MPDNSAREPEQFQKELDESPLPCLIDFYADWCGPCRIMNPVIEALKQEYQNRLRVIKINMDDNADLARKFMVRAIPTIIFFSQGKESWRIVGASPTELRHRIATSLRSS